MSATDPAETVEFNRAMHERITALGAVPVIDDLQSPVATNLLFRQLIFLLGAGGGGGLLYAYSDPAAGTPGVLVPTFGFGPTGTFAIGANWQVVPQPPVMASPVGGLTCCITLAGGAPDGADVFAFAPGTIAAPAFVPGPLPNTWQISYDEVGGVPTIFGFTWKGVAGFVFTNPAVL